jgi:uncharacterized protein YegJ (DUF2314 family)
MFGGLRRFLRKRQREREAEAADLKSLVWLLKEPRSLNLNTVLILARKALGDDFVDAMEVPDNPELPGRMFMVISEEAQGYGVICAHRPYVDNPEEAAEEIDELRRRSLFAEHKAWIAVDLMGEASVKKSLPKLGKLMAELAGPDCLLLYSTAHKLLEPWNEDLPDILRGPDPMSALRSSENPSVISAPEDDPELKSASDEALRRWPEFESAFRSGDKSCARFSVKAPFPTSEGSVEWMWVEIVSVLGNKIQGHVGNDPVDVPGLKLGSPVEVDKDKIQDWIYLRNGDMVGGFTAKVFSKRR